MIMREMSMPDGEVRLYCTRVAQVVSYFADDGEGGSVLWLEPGDMALLQDNIMNDVRAWILDTVAQRLSCKPEHVETLPIKYLCRHLAWQPEPPRHPWQFPRSRTPVKSKAR